MSDGFKVNPQALGDFGKHLDELEDGLRGTAELAGGCFMDPGLFGIHPIGQLMGTGASLHCGKARDQLNKYADGIAKSSEALAKAKKSYEEEDDDAKVTISEYEL